MKLNFNFYAFFSLKLLFLCLIHHSQAQPAIYGYTCSTNKNITNYPCQTYVHYVAQSPNFLDLASIGDLFNLSRLSISKPSNISNASLPLIPNQSMFIPISCGCNTVKNETLKAISFAPMTYSFTPDDNLYDISFRPFESLTTYQSVQVVNPTITDVYNISVGTVVYFPIFCKCPNNTQLLNKVKFLVSYVFQPDDTLDSIASKFGVTKQALVDINGNSISNFETVFVPLSQLPHLNQPNQPLAVPPVVGSTKKEEKKGTVIGLGIGLGICALLLILVCGVFIYRKIWFKKRKEDDFERSNGVTLGKGDGGKGYAKEFEQNLILADVSDTLDKYKVYEIDELRKGTNDFDERSVVQGCVYKGSIDGKLCAIKKMKWNAYDELKILQKVNHGSLVRLEGFSIDPDDATCYLVYEYIKNGSLYSWIHHKTEGTLNLKTRLRIAIDVANGLQYIHEHTRPQVVHKDIKSSNILLDPDMRAKIANFGLAKSGCNAITRHIVGTHGYIAPEYLCDGIVSPKMDVFSFGVVLLELTSGRETIDKEGRVLSISASEVWEGTTEEERASKMREWIDKSLVEEFSNGGIRILTNMMCVGVACVNKDPSKRPSMVDVVYALCKSDDQSSDVSYEFSASPMKAR